jgi:hypothetical protein
MVTGTDLQNGGYVFQGQPFIQSGNTEDQDYAFQGQPLVSNEDSPTDEDFEYIASCCLQIAQADEYVFSTAIQIAADMSNTYSSHLTILPNNLSAVTNASSPSNPLSATLISRGSVIYSHPSSLPDPSLWSNVATCYVKMPCQDLIGPRDATEITGWRLDIQDGSGTWEAGASVAVGDYFDEVDIFGFSGTIISNGFDLPSKPYLSAGILGKPKMNKQLQFLLYGSNVYAPNMNNQNLTVPSTYQYKTHQDAAGFITSMADSTLSWTVPDFPLANFLPQGSQRAIEALQSLASEVGAVVRFNGESHYTVTFPDVSMGLWEVPECCLITSFAKRCDGDLNAGYYSPGVYYLPQLDRFDAGTHRNNFNEETETSSNGTVDGRQIIDIYRTTTMKVVGNSPIEYVDLPADWQDIYIQIVASTAQGAQGQFCTLNPRIWFLLQTGFAGQYVNNIDVAGVLKPVVKIDPTLFPQQNVDLLAGPEFWYMKIGCTTKSLAAGTPADDVEEKRRIGRTIMRYKFVPVCTATISTAFFGSIPLPGMTARATLAGRTIEGIIESVSFSDPGIVTVNVVQWARLNFYEQLSEATSI